MENGYVDLDIRCRDCDRVFVLTAGEQAFFEQKGLRLPKRCKPCRQAKRINQPPQVTNRMQPSVRYHRVGEPMAAVLRGSP